MKTIDKILKEKGVDGYILTINRNPEFGYYELEVGIPKTWVYQKTDIIDFEVIAETEKNILLHIFPSQQDVVVIDDLIEFVSLIISTNEKILRMQQEFDDEMKKVKEVLENQAKEFYKKLEMVKDSSFTTLEENLKNIRKKQNVINDNEEKNIDNEEKIIQKLSK